MASGNAGALQLPNEEYEAQFFGFLPSSLMEGIVRLIEDRMSDAVDEVEENSSKIPECVLSRGEQARGVEVLRATTSRQTNKILTKLHHHLTGELLRLPSHLLLPCDLEQSKSASLEDVANINREIQDLHTQLNSELYMQAVLKGEIQETEQLVQRQQQVLSQCGSTNMMASSGHMLDSLSFLGENIRQQEQAVSKLQESAAAVVELAERENVDLSDVLSQRQATEDNLLT